MHLSAVSLALSINFKKFCASKHRRNLIPQEVDGNREKRMTAGAFCYHLRVCTGHALAALLASPDPRHIRIRMARAGSEWTPYVSSHDEGPLVLQDRPFAPTEA